jgi:hypothetical protein
MLRFVVALAVLAPLAVAQAAEPKPSKPDADPTAAGAAALDAAARAQRGETARAAPATLHGNFHLTYRDEKGNLVQAEVERWFVREPERMLTRTSEDVTGITSTEAFDGTTVWMRDDKKGTVFDYSAHPEAHQADFEKDRKQRRLTRLLMEALVLDALRPRLADVRLSGHETCTDLSKESHDVQLVKATAPDELDEPDPLAPPPAPGDPPPRLTLIFGIDAKDGRLWSLQVHTPGRPDYALRFDWHGPTRDGLSVPGNIRVYEAGATDPQVELGVAEDEEHHLQLELDTKVDAAMFVRPGAGG